METMVTMSSLTFKFFTICALYVILLTSMTVVAENDEDLPQNRDTSHCLKKGEPCQEGQCCSNLKCKQGSCQPSSGSVKESAPCQGQGKKCSGKYDCCSLNCDQGICQPSKPGGEMTYQFPYQSARESSSQGSGQLTYEAPYKSARKSGSGSIDVSPPCQGQGKKCSGKYDCCSLNCDEGICQPRSELIDTSPPCQGPGKKCSGKYDCCSRNCDQGVCQPPKPGGKASYSPMFKGRPRDCIQNGKSCQYNKQCCSFVCLDGTCTKHIQEPY